MDYKIISASADYEDTVARKLEEKVKKYIDLGWKPLGGVSISRSDYSRFVRIVMAQAMIKE